MKLLNPRTRIQTPVNWTAPARSVWNVSMSAGNMGARARGPKPCVNVTMAAELMQAIFQPILQLRGSFGSSLGWGTRTSRCAPLTKWWLPTSAMISVPGRISVWSSDSSCWRSCHLSILSRDHNKCEGPYHLVNVVVLHDEKLPI